MTSELSLADRRAAEMFLDHFRIIPGRPGEELLFRIVTCFHAIPWENLTKFLSKVRTEHPAERLRSPSVLISNYLSSGTGGTCFSLTDSLSAVLTRTGYRNWPVMADMSHGRNIHCALAILTAEGRRFLADPGYLVPVPVELWKGKGSRLSISGQTLVWKPLSGDRFDLFTVEKGDMIWRYRLRMQPVDPGEFLAHWVRSFDDTGMNGLHANWRSDGGRISAHNMNLRLVDGKGKRNLKLREQYGIQMERYFGISSTVASEAEKEWRRICQDR